MMTDSRFALVLAFVLALALLGARVYEFRAGRVNSADLNLVFQGAVTAVLGLLVWEVHKS